MKKLAFLFLTYNDVKRPDVWGKFFEHVPPLQYNVYCHAKQPDRVVSPFLRANLVAPQVPTKWADISLVRAEMVLFKHAYEHDPFNHKFILLSDSCIPIYPFADVYRLLTADDEAYVSSYDSNKSRYDSIGDKSFVSRENFKKQHQWMILNRTLAQAAFENDFADIFKNMFAPDEHYFVNVFHHLKLPFKNRFTTFTDWSKGKGAHPKIFNEVDCALVHKLRRQGFFFMRKVNSSTNVDLGCITRGAGFANLLAAGVGALLVVLAVLVKATRRKKAGVSQK